MIVRFKGEGYKLASAQYKNNRSQWKYHDSKKKKKKVQSTSFTILVKTKVLTQM